MDMGKAQWTAGDTSGALEPRRKHFHRGRMWIGAYSMGFKKASCTTRVGVTSSEVDRSGVSPARKQQRLAMIDEAAYGCVLVILCACSFRRRRPSDVPKAFRHQRNSANIRLGHCQKHPASTFELDFWTSE